MLLRSAVARPRAAIETVQRPWDELTAGLQAIFSGGGELEGGRSTAERLSPVAGAHRILTNSFASIPFSVYEKDGEGRTAVSDPALEGVLKLRPNGSMTPFLCKKVWMSNAFWYGVGRVWNRRNGGGEIIERIPLPTECCTIRRDRETGSCWYDYTVDGVRRTFSRYELSELFFESYDGTHGRGFLDLARESVAADALAQRYNKKFYQNGARLSGVLEVDADANRETRDKVKREFKAYTSDEAFAVAVLDHGMKYTPLGINQADAQYIETRQFSVEEVARFTGIPKHMLQVGKEAYESNDQQRIEWVTDTLTPYVIQCEQEDTYKVLTPGQREKGWYIKGNVAALLRADPKTRAEFYDKLLQDAILCPDECRAMEERNPIPGGLGKRFLVTKNLGSLESVLEGGAANG